MASWRIPRWNRLWSGSPACQWPAPSCPSPSLERMCRRRPQSLLIRPLAEVRWSFCMGPMFVGILSGWRFGQKIGEDWDPPFVDHADSWQSFSMFQQRISPLASRCWACDMKGCACQTSRPGMLQGSPVVAHGEFMKLTRFVGDQVSQHLLSIVFAGLPRFLILVSLPTFWDNFFQGSSSGSQFWGCKVSRCSYSLRQCWTCWSQIWSLNLEWQLNGRPRCSSNVGLKACGWWQWLHTKAWYTIWAVLRVKKEVCSWISADSIDFPSHRPIVPFRPVAGSGGVLATRRQELQDLSPEELAAARAAEVREKKAATQFLSTWVTGSGKQISQLVIQIIKIIGLIL